MERGWNPNVEITPNCPRCGSCNTKFCYYNNYSLTQPRYFCKGCRRFWTKGGSLRNVPVGGGCRRSRRGKFIRLSFDPAPPSRVFPYDNYNCLIDPTSSSNCRVSRNDPFTPGASKSENNNGNSGTIDIAQVYANFLNHQPRREARVEMTELPLSGGDHPSFHFASVSNMPMELNCSDDHLPLENGILDYSYGSGFDSIHKQQERIPQFTIDQNYGLPPLPCSEMMGPSPNNNLNASQTLPAAGATGIEQEAQKSDHFAGNSFKNSFHTSMSTSTSGYGTLFSPW